MKRGHFKSSVLLAALLVCPSWANQAPGSVDGQTAVGENVHSGALVSPAARAEIRAAASLVEKGKFAEAEAHARRSVELAPMSAEAQNLLGIICDQLGRAAEAEKAYDTALRLEPHLVSARNNLGNLLAREGCRDCCARSPDAAPSGVRYRRPFPLRQHGQADRK